MASSAPGDLADLFDRVADTYDAVGVEWFGPIAEGLVVALDPQPGERAVDIGCGRGAVLLRLAEAVGADGYVTGLDLAPRMVAAARRSAADQGLRQIEVRVADAAAPGLEAGAFDLVASSLVLFFLPDPAAAVAAWTSLLRPGGRLGVTTFGPNDPVSDQVDAVFMPYLPPGMRDARTTGRSGPFGSDAGMAALFRGAGLTAVRTVSTTVDAVLRDPDHWYEFTWSHGQRAMWEAVPAGERATVRRAAYAVLEPHRRDDGSIMLRQQVRYTLGRRPA